MSQPLLKLTFALLSWNIGKDTQSFSDSCIHKKESSPTHVQHNNVIFRSYEIHNWIIAVRLPCRAVYLLRKKMFNPGKEWTQTPNQICQVHAKNTPPAHVHQKELRHGSDQECKWLGNFQMAFFSWRWRKVPLLWGLSDIHKNRLALYVTYQFITVHQTLARRITIK